MDFVLKKDENYYSQVFLKECKYIEKKLIRHIHDNLSDFSSSSDNKLELVRLSVSVSNGECTQKKRVVFWKLCLQFIKIHY